MSWQLIGGRKFLLSASALVINAALVLHGDIESTIYRYIIIATVAVYIAGNVSQKVMVKENA